jgi:hypothetical protein
MDIINERSSAYIEVSFFDKNGVAAVPTTITYSTKCLTTGTAIKTNITVPPASKVTINLDALDSVIQVASNPQEDKALTIKASYGLNDESNAEYYWRVKNLSGV